MPEAAARRIGYSRPVTARLPARHALLAAALLAAAPLVATAQPSTASAAVLAAASLDPFLGEYRAASPERRAELWRQLVAARRDAGGFPMIEDDGEAVFLYHGDGGEDEVRLVGDFATKGHYDIYWDERGLPMPRVAEGSPLFVARLEVEPDARLDYAFAVAGERIADPLNPRRLFSGSGGGEVSELVMPGYRFDPALSPAGEVERGTLHTVDEPWVAAPITVYLPPGASVARRYPVLYVADGSAWRDLLGLPDLLDRLIAGGEIEPLVAVMIDPPKQRSVSYFYDRDLLAYLERVVAHVDDRFPTRRGAAHRVHAGTSAGGRASLFAVLERPDLFVRAAALSPALHGPLSYWQPYLDGTKQPPTGAEVWLSAGTYEPGIAADAEAMAQLLRRHGIAPTLVTTREGHSFGTWRNLVPRMLRALFPVGGSR